MWCFGICLCVLSLVFIRLAFIAVTVLYLRDVAILLFVLRVAFVWTSVVVVLVY